MTLQKFFPNCQKTTAGHLGGLLLAVAQNFHSFMKEHYSSVKIHTFL